MAWADVPAKLDEYDAHTYAPDNAALALLLYFGVKKVDDVPAHRRDEFEEALDYRLGACKNLDKSRAIKPWLLR